jgi:hypothetical protein
MPTATGCVVKTSAAVVGVYVFNKCGELMYGLNANAQTSMQEEDSQGYVGEYRGG